MPNINNLSTSKYRTKEDVGTGRLVTITGYKQQDVSKESDPSDVRYILTLDDGKPEGCKPVVLNKTNGNRIAEIMHTIHGVTRDLQQDEDGEMCPANEQFQNWTGKKIILWNNPDIEFQGKRTGGIRVREPASTTPGTMSPPQQQQYNEAAPPAPVDDTDYSDFPEDAGDKDELPF